MIFENLSINLQANIGAFQKKLKAAGGMVGGFAGKVKSAASRAGGMLGSGLAKSAGVAKMGLLGLAGAAAGAATALGGLALAQFDSLDALGKTSDKLGITTEGLAGLRHAAEQTAGVSAGALDTALQRMTRRVSEAAAGTGTAKDALKELGLDAQRLNFDGPEEAFYKISNAMQGVESQQDRLRLAFKLFDTEGAALVNTLGYGEDALKAYKQEAKDLGLGVSREEIAKIEAANDAWDKAKKAIVGVGNTLAIELAPYITQAANMFVDFVKTARTYLEPWGKWLKDMFAELQFVVMNFADIWMVSITKLVKGTVSMALDIVHWFTNVLPTAFMEFGRLSGEIFSNITSNVGNQFSNMWDYIWGESDTLFHVWEPLEKGFQHSMDKIAASMTREQSGIEKALSEDIKTREDALAKRYSEFMKDREDAAQELQKTAKDIDKGRKEFVPKPEADKKKFEPKTVGALEQGSVAAVQAILDARAARNQSDPSLKVAEDTNKQMKEQNRILKDISKNIGQDVAIATL